MFDTKHSLPVPLLYLITCSLAFCSIVYELILAQCLSITLGQSILRYSTTIGLYLFSLGLGSLASHFFPTKYLFRKLLKIEICLAFLGLLIPIIAFLLSPYQKSFSFLSISSFSYYLMAHSLVMIIAFLSGIELPLLMKIGQEIGGEKIAYKVLAFDYLATFLGAICFPLWIIYSLGIVAGVALTALLNTLAAALLFFYSKEDKLFLLIVISLLACTAMSVFILESEIREYISQSFIS